MHSLLTDLFEYYHHFNQKMIEELEKHADALPPRSYPLFCHVLNAHQIWNARIMSLPQTGVHAVYPIHTLSQMDKENFRDTSKIIGEYDLEKVIEYKNSRGATYSNTIRDILLHVANHTTHHRGQIISDFRQSGIEPLVTDYIFYKR